MEKQVRGHMSQGVWVGVRDGSPFQLGEEHLPQDQPKGTHLIWLEL